MTMFADMKWQGTAKDDPDTPQYCRIHLPTLSQVTMQSLPKDKWTWITMFKYEGGKRYGMIVQLRGKTIFNQTDLDPIEAQCALMDWECKLIEECKND